MGEVLKDLTTVLTLIIITAIIGVLVSKNATTANVLNSGSSAFNSALATAQSAVTGYSPGPPVYASSSSAFGFGAPMSGLETGAGFNSSSFA
jgi:hypothetical protein